MPLPRRLARLNRYLANPVLRPLAARLPWFGVLVHRGRSTGRLYRTPLNVFATDEGFVVALTYGPDVDWLANLEAAGRGELVHRGRSGPVIEPRRVGPEEARTAIPAPVRGLLTVLGVRWFVVLRSDGR